MDSFKILASKRKLNSTFLMAGWLFADLLLALGIIFLFSDSKNLMPANQEVFLPETTTPSSQQTVSPSQLAISSATPVELDISQIGLDTQPVIFTVQVNPKSFVSSETFEISRFQTNLGRFMNQYLNSKVGLVITLGYHDNIGMGMQMARRGNAELLSSYPEVFNNSVMKPFWYSTDEINVAGVIKFEIYFLRIMP